ncbi:MAG: vitamin K epoxide reductase family protein [Dissulfurimicrobium sp.]|uniref:vitamin K epoxide reductase family protein n=1 Tax=Dissulfurimicrobium hydrothermale TaxID=1750598 RepID=UPI003C780930
MDKKSITFPFGLNVLAFLGSLVVLAQIGAILIRGEAVCLNEGCKIAENFVSINQIYVNLVGLGYFQTIFWTGLLSRRKAWAMAVLPGFLLAGLGVEGVLIGLQTFVVHSFCSYCLLIFLFIVLMNVCVDLRHLFVGGLIFVTEFFIFSALKLDEDAFQKRFDLDSGTYAVRQCNDPRKRLYLIFSEDCPHCKAVLDVLKTCSACEVHFNPVTRPRAEILPGLEPLPRYEPKANKVILRILGIYTIPVLIVENRDGLSFIKGQDSIIRYVKDQCASTNSANLGLAPTNPFDQQGVCSFEEPCK